MTPTATRIIAYLSNNPATRVDIAEACATTISSVHKITARLIVAGEIEIIGYRTHIGYRGSGTTVPIYAIIRTPQPKEENTNDPR